MDKQYPIEKVRKVALSRLIGGMEKGELLNELKTRLNPVDAQEVLDAAVSDYEAKKNSGRLHDSERDVVLASHNKSKWSSGSFQVRFVAGVYSLLTAFGVISNVAQLSSGRPLASGSAYSTPAQLLFSVVYGALAFYLLKGSNKARITLAIFSVLAIVVFLLYIFVLISTSADELPDIIGTVFVAAIGILFSACGYFLVFSKSLKSELSRRAEATAQKELSERRKLDESMGERFKE